MTDTKPSLLLVDDEERILRSLAMLFRANYAVQATTDPQEAIAIVRRGPVHVVVSDQKMPLMQGAALLREIRTHSPNTMRILLTGYSELDAIIASVNEGEIFRYVNKPWNAAELKATVEQAARIATASFSMSPAAPAQTAEVAALAEELLAFTPSPTHPEAVLVVDDDADVFAAVRSTLGATQQVYWARSMEQMFAYLEQYPIGVIVTELMVARESMTTALKLLKAQQPEVVTIVMTPFRDTATLVGLINQGQVYRLLPKPVRQGPLGMNLASALRQHRLLKASPARRERYVVEKTAAVEDVSVATRVMGFLGRLRLRTAQA